MTKVVNISSAHEPSAENPVMTPETMSNILRKDKTGKALMLYLYYVLKAIDQNSPQPYATDEYCAKNLRLHVQTVRKARRILQSIGVVMLIRKRRKNYIRVNYMPFKIEGPSNNLSTEKMPEQYLGTPVAFDFFTEWFKNIVAKPSPFIRAVIKKAGQQSEDSILNALEVVWIGGINTKLYGIDKLDTELRFFHYLVEAVANKLRK